MIALDPNGLGHGCKCGVPINASSWNVSYTLENEMIVEVFQVKPIFAQHTKKKKRQKIK